MTTTNLKPHVYISNAFYSHPIEQRDANVLTVFNEFKSKFKLREAFKVKGVLFEFYSFDAGTYSYYLILKNGQVEWHTGSNVYAPAIDKWQKLIGIEFDQYINGSPYYRFINGAKNIEPVKMDNKYLEFCRIRPQTMPGAKMSKEREQIGNTPYYVGRSIMYRYNSENKPEFFYDKEFRIHRYDVEYNLSIEKRFNTRWFYPQLGALNKKQVIEKLVKHLTEEHQKAANGYWGDRYNPETDSAWINSNPIEAVKLASQIESVKQYLLEL